ncbi:hypothetical protein TrLO_g13923 [Triparma laevis f. longispina]|uniref:Uncharacterized protein n=1 Tax=Triparma laevis f. longispina TaxID=1714387 RepID=A0A9W6ZHZ5_9STRA|nr:hypothetical protein TrLO_g13923 [Triparma laevis f. longispina]
MMRQYVLFLALLLNALLGSDAYQSTLSTPRRRALSPLHLVVKSSSGAEPLDSNSRLKRVILVSDSTGATAQKTLNRAFSQFDSCSTLGKDDCELQVNVFSHVTNEETLAGLIRRAKDQSALMIYTLSDPELRSKSLKMCELSAVHSVDLMGPLLDGLSSFLEEAPLGTPGGDDKVQRQDPRKTTLSSSYYKRIEAVEFTLKADDGSAPWLLKDADVILVGVSRTGKTPLSVVLAQQFGLKVANIPLVLEVPPPKELFEPCIDNDKVMCLTINPVELKRIRLNRLERSGAKQLEEAGGVKTATNYADRNYLMRDLKNARDLAQKYNYTEIDVTGRAVEETASLISELLTQKLVAKNVNNIGFENWVEEMGGDVDALELSS